MRNKVRGVGKVWGRVMRTLFFVFVSFTLGVSVARGQGASNASASLPQTANVSDYTPTFTYDVATIKKCAPADSFRVGFSDLPHSGTFSAWHKSAKELVEEAYGVDYLNLSGGPGWLDSDYFDIEAKSNSSINQRLGMLTDDQAKLEKQHMLQTLLVERFNLKVHWVMKEVPGYSLIVGKSGSKLKEAKIETADAAGASDADHPKPSPLQTHSGPSGYELTVHGMPMKFLVTLISHDVRAPVVDRTSLTGRYDFTLQFLPQRQEATDTAWASIFTAVQEQLGLRLESTKTSVAALVIDSIERPSAN